MTNQRLRYGVRILLALGVAAGLAWLGAGCQSLPPSDPLYGARIVIPADAGKDLQGTAAELAHYLGQMTGRPFTIETNLAPGAAGILLCRTNAAVLPPGGLGTLPGRGPEAYRLRSAGDRLWIVGNTGRAIDDGVYGYLDRLGCRWFLPNEHWTIVPRRDSIALALDTVEAPAFRLRNFFGTGGWGGRLPVDTNQSLQARWELWKKRNRLGGSVAFSGHAGEAFIAAHKKELAEHPEYLAEIDGKRQPAEGGTKPCYANAGLRKLYVADRLAALKRMLTTASDAPNAFAVSVEPSDGGGHCTCAECLKIGSVSDRVFTLADEVARAVATNYPGHWVSLFAYNEHAAVPRVAIETNVYVLVVPYGFQRTGLPGDDLLQAWGAKHRPLGVYDYWSIPDWANCLPSLSPTRTVPEKIRFWHQQGVEAFLGESSTSAGAVGLVWYLGARLLWDPAADDRAAFDDFCRQAFGPAAPPMRRLLERWGAGFRLAEHDLALAWRDLQEARTLAGGDEAVRARLDDYASYLEYLSLWEDYQGSRGNAELHREATRAVLRFCWRTYDSTMVQPFRMHQLIINRYEKGDTVLAAEFPLNNPAAPVWKSLSPPTRDEIDQWVADGVRRFQPLEFEARQYSTNFVPLTIASQSGAVPTTAAVAWVSSPTLVGGAEFIFPVRPGQTNVLLRGRVNARPTNSPGDRFTVFDPKGAVVRQDLLPPDAQWHPLAIPTTLPGLYRLSVFDQKITFEVQAPADLPFVLRGGISAPFQSARLYFWVPAGLRRLAFYGEGAIPVDLRDGDGKKVAHNGKNLCVVDVPAGQDGRAWSVAGYKSYTPWYLLNAPNAFASTPAGLMIPAELAGDRSRNQH